jgi:hypothetical protein
LLSWNVPFVYETTTTMELVINAVRQEQVFQRSSLKWVSGQVHAVSRDLEGRRLVTSTRRPPNGNTVTLTLTTQYYRLWALRSKNSKTSILKMFKSWEKALFVAQTELQKLESRKPQIHKISTRILYTWLTFCELNKQLVYLWLFVKSNSSTSKQSEASNQWSEDQNAGGGVQYPKVSR